MIPHRLEADSLEPGQIPLITELAVPETVAAVPVRLARPGIFGEWHQAALTTRSWF